MTATQLHVGDIAYFPSAEQLSARANREEEEEEEEEGEEEEGEGEEGEERQKRGATSQDHLLWPNGIIHYSFSSQFTGTYTLQ